MHRSGSPAHDRTVAHNKPGAPQDTPIILTTLRDRTSHTRSQQARIYAESQQLRFTHCSSCSQSNRYRTSCTLLTISQSGDRLVGKDLTINNRGDSSRQLDTAIVPRRQSVPLLSSFGCSSPLPGPSLSQDPSGSVPAWQVSPFSTPTTPIECLSYGWSAPRTRERRTGGSGGGVPDEGCTSSAFSPALGTLEEANPAGADGNSTSGPHPDVIHSPIRHPVCPVEIVCRSRTGSRSLLESQP